MHHLAKTVTVLLLLAIPATSFAAHRSSRIDTSDLNDDPVASMPTPVLFGVDMATVVPDFGDPRGGGTRMHEGQDFRAPLGTPIVSPTEAVVLSTGTGASAGKYVYTANPGGEQFRYMHLDYIADLDPGDTLDVGDFIGTVGDTGNAPDGVYHLHFEIRANRTATDPYPRLTDEFTLKEKISFLEGVFDDIPDADEYAENLIVHFSNELSDALSAGYDMPRELEDALEDAGIVSRSTMQKQLNALLAQIPAVLQMELSQGDQSNAVVLLQVYLMYTGEGEARNALIAAGPTGYYGSITAAAVMEYQTTIGVAPTGVYDAATRLAMIKSSADLAK